jgi:hypothetical protein
MIVGAPYVRRVPWASLCKRVFSARLLDPGGSEPHGLSLRRSQASEVVNHGYCVDRNRASARQPACRRGLSWSRHCVSSRPE